MKTRPWLLWLPVFAAVSFSVFYWITGYAGLSAWYHSLYPGFYKANKWDTEYFTPAVYARGKMLSGGICLALVLITWWGQRYFTTTFPKLNVRVRLSDGVVFVYGLLVAFLLMQQAAPSTDEVFSAVNFASLPAFQTLSFYPIPNNHIFFNLLNGSLFSSWMPLVQSGRLISALAYSGILIITWRFLQKYLEPAGLAVLALLWISVQFPVIGFATQARGYELGVLLSLLTLSCYWQYHKTANFWYLLGGVLTAVLGFLNLPTFLCFWSALMGCLVVMQLQEKKLRSAFLWSFVCTIVLVLTVYLPLFCFSGTAAIASNRYVVPEMGNPFGFLFREGSVSYWKGLFAEWYGLPNSSILPGFLLWLSTAFILFFQRQRPGFQRFWLFFLSVSLSVPILAAGMRKWPFYRNLTLQGYILELGLMLVIARLLTAQYQKIVLGLVLSAGIVWSVYSTWNKVPAQLYYYPVNEFYAGLKNCVWPVPAGADIFVEEEAFYLKPILEADTAKHWNVTLNAVHFSGQAYVILSDNSKWIPDSTQYKLLEQCSDFRLLGAKVE